MTHFEPPWEKLVYVAGAPKVDRCAWVSVDERMPAPLQSVALVDIRRLENLDFDRHVHAAGFLNVWGGGFWSILGARATSLDSFTHWMPLPGPPGTAVHREASETDETKSGRGTKGGALTDEQIREMERLVWEVSEGDFEATYREAGELLEGARRILTP